MYRLYCILSAVSIIMINQKQNKGKQNIGSFLLLPAYGRVGQGQHFLAAYFAKRNTKNCGGEKARAGREFIFPIPLFLPAPPERKLLKFSVGIFAEKSSDFVQDRQQKVLRSFSVGYHPLPLINFYIGFHLFFM